MTDWTPEAKQAWYDEHAKGRKLYRFADEEPEPRPGDAAEYVRKEPVPEGDLESAELIGSQIKNDHWAVIDVDVPIHIEPSTTPGHFHLYIQEPLGWGNYQELLEALRFVRLVEHGYVEATKSHGQSFVRLPWIKKESK